MAVEVVNLPVQPTPMGWADFGQSLDNAATGYVQQNRLDVLRQQQLADEARKRQEQLQDTQSSRMYEEDRDTARAALERNNFDYMEKARTDADKLHEANQLHDKIAEALAQNGYLDPSKANDQTAFQAAYAAAKRDGLIDKYKDLISHGYLQIGDIDDPNKVADAQKKAAQTSTDAFSAAAKNKAAAQGTAGNVAAQIATENAKKAKIEAAVEQAQAAAENPDPRQVRALADQIASKNAAKPGFPSSAERQAAIADATAQIKQQAEERAAQLSSEAKPMLGAIERNLASLNTRATQFDKAGVFADPDASTDATDAGGTAALAPTTGPSFDQNKTSVLAGLTGGGAGAPQGANPGVGAPPSPTPAALQPLPGADTNPYIATENQRRSAVAQQQSAGDWQKNLAQPYDDTLDQIQEVQQELTALNSQAYGAGYDGIAANQTVPFTPQQRAERIVELNQKMNALQVQLQQKKRAMLGVPAGKPLGMPGTASATAVPAFSNVDGSVPTPPPTAGWWSGNPNMADTGVN